MWIAGHFFENFSLDSFDNFLVLKIEFLDEDLWMELIPGGTLAEY